MKSLFGHLFGRVQNQQRPSDPTDQRPSIIEVEFDERDRHEAHVAWLWREYTQAVVIDSKYGSDALRKFFAAFLVTFEHWAPDGSLPPNSGFAAAAAVGGVLPGTHEVRRVRGCRDGHPHAVVAALAEALAHVPDALMHVVRREAARPEELQEQALQILLRSHHNRGLFVGLGGCRELAHIIKATLPRLTTMAAIIGVRDSTQLVGTQVWFLQCLLAHTLYAVEAFIAGAVRACVGPDSPPLMALYLSSEPRYCCAHIREPGSSEAGQALDLAMQPLLLEGFPALLLETLKLLSLMRSRGADVVAKWEELVVECLMALMAASVGAQAQLRGSAKDGLGMPVLARMLGWPAAAPQSAAGSSDGAPVGEVRIRGCSLRAAADELRAQALVLQTIGATVRRNKGALQDFIDAGGFHRITQLLQWTALSFAPAASSPPAEQAGPKSGGHGSPAHVAKQRGSHQWGRLARFGIPESPELAELFAVLASWLSLRQHKPRIAWDRLAKYTMVAVLNAFRPLPESSSHQHSHPEQHARALAALSHAGTALPHHALQLLGDVLRYEPSMLGLLRKERIWALAYGKAFFCLGQPELGSPRKPRDSSSDGEHEGPLSPRLEGDDTVVAVHILSDEARGTVTVSVRCGALRQSARSAAVPGPAPIPSNAAGTSPAAAAHSGSGSAGAAGDGQTLTPGALLALRAHVVHVTELAAILPGLETNEEECRQLLDLMEHWVLEGEVVMLAAPALTHILGSEPERTLAAFERCDALGVLARAIQRQQRADLAAQKVLEGVDAAVAAAAAASAEAQSTWNARLTTLSLLSTYLHRDPSVQRRSVRNWDTVAVLFMLLWEARTRRTALTMVVGLMRMAPVTEDDQLAKAALFTKYVEALPHALDGWPKRGLEVVSDLLLGMQDVVAADPENHQNLFRNAECFVQIINLLNLDYPPALGARLCEEVLGTLCALLAGNEASRKRLRNDVGYDTLLSILLRRAAPRGPSQSLLLKVLGLILEHEYDPSATGQTVANADAVPLFFKSLREAEPAVQEWGLGVWGRLLQGSMANLAACDGSGVNGMLVDWFAASADDLGLQTHIAALLQITGAYSISGRDLRAIFALLRKDAGGQVAPHALPLLRMLCVMARHKGPSAFFDFGNPTAGILRTTALRLPPSRGYSFATWLRLESAKVEEGLAGRALYTLLSRTAQDVRGVSAAFLGGQLRVRCAQPRLAEAALNFQFLPQRWYHVAITHSAGSTLSAPLVRLYVNGVQEHMVKFRYPKVPEALNWCSFGARLSARETGLDAPVGAFLGQMGCLYLFEDVLTPGHVAALHALGPHYQATFSPSESNPVLEQAPAAAELVIHGKEALGPRLMLSYNAQAAAGRLLYNTSDMERGGADGDTATMGEGTQLCCTCQLRDILHCLSGVAVLLPLVAQLDAPVQGLDGSGEDASRAVDVVKLLAAVLEDSPSNRQTIEQMQGIALMAYLLQQRSPRHLTTALAKALEGLVRAVRPSEDLTVAVLERLLLNLNLWSAAPADAQRFKLATYARHAKSETERARRLMGVPRILDSIRAHHGEAASPDAVRPSSLQAEEVRALRRGLLEVAGAIMRTTMLPSQQRLPPEVPPRAAPADLQAALAFIGDCPDVAMLEDVLGGLVALLTPGSSTRAPLAAGLRAVNAAYLCLSLLQREQQALRVLGLKLLSACLPKQHHSSAGAPGEDVAEAFWAAVSDALLMFPLTQPVRLALLDLLCGGSAQRGDGRPEHRQAAGPTIMAAPAMGILLQLLPGCDDANERLYTLSTLCQIITEGPAANRAAIVRQLGWEEWLLELLVDGSPCLPASPNPMNYSEPQAHAAWRWVGQELEFIRAMLRALHGHALQHLPRGWTALYRTAYRLRTYSERGVVDGWGLFHELLSDVVDDLLGRADPEHRSAHSTAQHNQGGPPARQDIQGGSAMSPSATADAWTMVSSVATEPCRENAIWLLGVIDELMAGTLLPVGGQRLRPTAEAAAWAERGGSPPVPPDAWLALGVPADKHSTMGNEAFLTVGCWGLYHSAWQLITVLQKALATMDGLASLSPRGQAGLSPRSRPAPSSPAEALMRQARGLVSPSGQAPPTDGTDEGGRPAPEEGSRQGLAERAARLTMRLLMLYLRKASTPMTHQCVAQAAQLLPTLLDPASEHARDRLHLLLSALMRIRSMLQSEAGLENRCELVGRAIAAICAATKPVLAASWGSGPESPPLPGDGEGPFWEQVQAVLQAERVARAVGAEVEHMRQMVARHGQALRLLEEEGEQRHMRERRWRHDVTQHAREALGMLCAAERSRRAAARSAYEEEQAQLARKWRDVQRSLSSDRGLWAEWDRVSETLHWKLDRAEDVSRRRLKLKRNYRFQMYSDPVKGAPAAKRPEGDDVPEAALLAGVPKRTNTTEDDGEEEAPPSPRSAASPRPASPANPAPNPSQPGGALRPTLSQESLAEEEQEAERVQGNEQVLFVTACQLVTPKHVVPGTLRLMPGQLHFIGDLPAEEATRANQSPGEKPKASRTHKRWPLGRITEVHHARYLLQPNALEIFLADRSNALLNFADNKVMRAAAGAIQSVTQRISVLDRKRKVDLARRLHERWQRWEVSNFDYLMQLNSLAGRTYNDLNQYPVFPWIIADYESGSLDLTEPATFRDLAKPMGALNPKRLQFFLERYESLRAVPDPDVPPFHYGSHYSSAGAVLFYLVRQEPFTAMNRQLQGGRFDHADRLFHSIGACWRACLEASSDVKELTPEFFYQPDFLLNANAFNLGSRQDGVALNDVLLPAWANGSPDEFVRIQREALESDYVSEHLHEWVDLVFGFRQRGRAAEEAVNVFYYLTYEDAVDLDALDDPMQRRAVEDQISNFGQTPFQLFKKALGKRGPPPSPAARPLLNGPDSMKLATVGHPNDKRPNIGVAKLQVTDSRIIMITADRFVSCHKWISPRADTGAFTFSSAAPELAYAVEADPTLPRMLGTPFAADLDFSHCYGVLPGGQIIASCGYWDNSIRCYAVDDGRLLQSLRQHKDIVTCIAVGNDGRTLVSGSRDTTLIIWDAVAGQRARARSRGFVPGLALSERPRHILYGHEDAVTCIALSPELDLVVSASANGTMLFHTLGEGRYVRTLVLPDSAPPSLLAIAPGLGMLIAHSQQDLALHAYTINGRHLVSAEGTEKLRALAVSPDGRFLLTGGAKGTVTLRWLHSLQVVLRYEGGRGPITSLAVTPEDCILGGTLDGCLLVFTPDPRRRITRRYNLADARSSSAAAPSCMSPSGKPVPAEP
ncbi:hypothetical protein WJX72_007613 [[Myrmecia] bisecta]|uniref:Uncharacterized protein n=1 Tax=[Myrmecia] bisecta TaxID=41462 RepID=A0AAW1QRJ8_9CHLO